MLPQYCFTKRCLVMTGGLTLSSLLIFYGVFGLVYSTVIRIETLEKQKSDSARKELQLVHVLSRHGPRTPADTYPNDPYVNEVFYPVGWGQLTIDGKASLYKTGKWLRKRYSDFLGPMYYPDMLHAQATGVSRTHMSLALLLAGLWPPKGTPNEWNEDLNWQPIPIFSEELNKDTLLLVRTPCPRYYEALDEVYDLPEVKSILKENYPMMRKLSEITGLNITTADDVQSLYSTLRAEHEFGLKLPLWTKYYYPDKLQYLTEMSFIFNVYNDELKRIKGGPFVKKMIDEWVAAKEGKLEPENRKIYMYTGHDATVVNILSAMNVWERQVPVYGIMALFELYKDKATGEFEVQIFLKNETNREPYPLVIPGCDLSCPISKIQKLTSSIIPVNKDQQCKAHNPDYTEPPLGGP